MFIPPHCPNPECEHYDQPDRTNWYHKAGLYSTSAFGSVQRFTCKTCQTGFSRQTFSIDYFAKRRLDYRYIHHQINDLEKRQLRHAQVAGLDRLELDRLRRGFFTRRVFRPKGLVLSESAQRTLNRRWITPLKRNREVLWRYPAA